MDSPQRQRPQSPRPSSPRFMQATASTVTRAVSNNGGGAPSSNNNHNAAAAAPLVGSGAAALGTLNAEARAQMQRSVQLRAEMRQQRIRERTAEASTAEAAYQDPAEQWSSYLAKCGKWKGPGRKGPSPERVRHAHQTAGRVFQLGDANDGAESVDVSDAPVVDSHGLWVGEKVDAMLSGAAGATSESLWRKKEEGMLEFKRHSYLAKSAAAASVDPEVRGDVGAAAVAALSSLNADDGKPIAGSSSKKLSKDSFERGGLIGEVGGKGGSRAPSPKMGRPSHAALPHLADDAQTVDERPKPLRGPAPSPSRGGGSSGEVAGLTSSELFMANHMNKERTPAPPQQVYKGEGVAGVSSDQLNANSTEMKLEATSTSSSSTTKAAAASSSAAAAVHDYTANAYYKPEQRPTNEVKVALTENPTPHLASAGHPIDIASNAPRPLFDGAAGMNSKQVYKVTRGAEQQQRRHTSSLDSEIGAPGSMPEGQVAAALSPEKAAATRPPNVPRLSLGAAAGLSLGSSPPGASSAYGETAGTVLNHAANAAADAAASHRKPSPHALRPPPFGVEDGHRFAGQRSAAMARPTSAWEARHLWSESAPKAPKGGFGAAVPGGAGVTSEKLSRDKNVELKFDGVVSGASSPVGPRLRKPVPQPGQQQQQQGGEAVAGLTSTKLYEIGVGSVNKFDSSSPSKIAQAAAKRASAALEASIHSSGRIPGSVTGAAGLTSNMIAQKAVSEMTAEQRKLSLLAAHAAHARGALSPGRAPVLHATTAFKGAAGVTSEAVGREAVTREFVAEMAHEEAVKKVHAAAGTPNGGHGPRPLSPFARHSGLQNNSSGVAGVFGGADNGAAAAAHLSPAAARATASAMAHGLSSRAIAIQKLVSRTNHGAGAGRRTASEPRRRPQAAGDNAGHLLYGERFGDGSSSTMTSTGQHDLNLAVAAKQSGANTPGGGAASRVAGRTSSDLHVPREERNVYRPGNSIDNLRGLGGLGHYMTGGEPIHENGQGGSLRRHSLGPVSSPGRGNSSHFQSSSSVIGGGFEGKAAAQANLGWAPPSRSATGMRTASPRSQRAPSPSRNASSIDFGGGGVWGGGAMVASSSAVGAHAAHPASPVRGLRA